MWLALSVTSSAILLAVWFGWQRSRLAVLVGELQNELVYLRLQVQSLENENAEMARAPLDGPTSVAALRRVLDSDDA